MTSFILRTFNAIRNSYYVCYITPTRSDKLTGILGLKTTTPLFPLILKRDRHAKMANQDSNLLEGNASDKEKDDLDKDKDKEGNPDTSKTSLDLPATDASDNPLPVEDPLSEEDDLDDMDDRDDMENLEDLDDMDDMEDQEDQDSMEDLESLSDKPSDEITKALEDLEDKAKDKITVKPIKSYENSYEMRRDVLTDNTGKAGVYR